MTSGNGTLSNVTITGTDRNAITASYTSSLVSGSVSFSISQSVSNSYLPYMLSSDPYGSTDLYIHKFFPSMSISGSGAVSGAKVTIEYGQYNHARTPNIISQYDDDLFSIHTISDGNYSNT